MEKAQAWIDRLGMVEHPEGGFFHENYRANESIPKSALPSRYRYDHSYSTAIYYLLAGADFSSFHLIASDEIWHFYDGATILVHLISANRGYTTHLLGVQLEEGDVPQLIIPKDTWMAAEMVDKSTFGFIGCTVAPGFDFSDCEMANAAKLVAQFPEREALIRRLTRPAREMPGLLADGDGETS
ncbi:MAG: cupin domain-containing protein [Verrucomicrobia bacterium]|nr:cupin domain-containing protein [Verrucomicrobiota bacterium]